MIAKSGYADSLRRMAFFPVYPGLIHIVGFVTRSDLVAGVVISLIAFMVALALLYRLVLLDFGEDVAATTVMLVAFCPVAFFFSAVYTESLFLALSVGAIYAARRERWLAAGLLGGFAAATRNGGVALILPVAVIYFYGPRTTGRARRTRWAGEALSGVRLLLPRYRLRVDAIWMLLIPAGLGAYLAYLGITAPLLLKRLRGTWPKPDHGSYFSLGRWGLPVNLMAVLYGAVVAVNIAWPCSAVYDSLGGTKDSSGHIIPSHWYWQYIAILFIGITVIVGSIYYFLVYNRKPISVLAEHAAEIPSLPGAPAMGEMAP